MKKQQTNFFKELPQPNMTPMMQQYANIKMLHQDCLLFYRMGDFYELFFEDAIIAAPVLDIALTKRGKQNGDDIPMCGVPYHAYEYYLLKLLKAGHKVAICEQLETPEEAKKRGYKEVVRREVVRIITPGTLLEETLLDSKQANYLMSIALWEGMVATSWVDISTGEFSVSLTNAGSLASELARLSPSEIIIPEKILTNDKARQALAEHQKKLSIRANSIFDFNRAENKLKEFFKLRTLEGAANFHKAEVVAAAALLEYLEHTQKGCLPRINLPKKIESRNFMCIDAATRRNLEIERDMDGNKKNSLLYVIDKTVTSIGGRLLSTHLSSPLCDPQAINRRLDNVAYFVEQSHIREAVRQALKHFPDMERAMARIHAKRGMPRDLGMIRDGLAAGFRVAEIFFSPEGSLPPDLKVAIGYLGGFGNLLDILENALRDELPINFKEGNFIKEGYNLQLDNLRKLKGESHNKIARLKERYQAVTNIPTLKITCNNILGYYIEITSSHAKKINSEVFIHRQSLGNATRYTTLELQKLEKDLATCEDGFIGLELELFQQLTEKVIESAENISLIAQSIGMIDVASSLAELAVEQRYNRPLVDDAKAFVITKGRHPVVENFLGSKFIANDCNLNANQNLWLITGPNMAGKSTFLRQNALIAILAQMGSYVPAEAAHIGVIDKLFSRIGAGDDISRGRSTFLVEMAETANILNNATANSLVILDELGRGTATYDGLSIAWAVIEEIHAVLGSRTLFATHYHELTELESRLEHLRCYTMKITEWEGKLIFLHEIISGKADKSYGIHVAELAGVPKNVIDRASTILETLQVDGKKSAEISSPIVQVQPVRGMHLVEELLRTDIDHLTPHSAFEILYKLKNGIQGN